MTEGSVLVLAIANEWERISALLGEGRDQVEQPLTTLLRRLDAQGEDSGDIVRAIIKLFVSFPAAHMLLLKTIGSAAPNKGGAMPAGFVKKDRYTVIPIFYGTDRAHKAMAGSAPSYGPE